MNVLACNSTTSLLASRYALSAIPPGQLYAATSTFESQTTLGAVLSHPASEASNRYLSE